MVNPAILCVDDENIILDSLKEQLEKYFGNDYVYETAENAEEGLELIEELLEDEIKILIIVSDWLMPGINGDEFLIKVHQKYPSIVKILLAGQANEEAINKAKKHANLFAVLNKPWSQDELFKLIKSGLRKNE